MNFFRSLNIINNNFATNGLQLNKVLTHNDFYGIRNPLVSIGLNSCQKRSFAARKGKRIAANREKLRLARIKREEAKNVAPKVWVPQRLRVDKSTLNVGPRRFSDKHLKDLDTIVDDVFVTELYKQITYSLVDAIDMHRETHEPSMLNEPNALVDATVELDLRTKKKTRFLDTFKGIISYPNKFEFSANRKIIAICKKEEDQWAAKEAGADVVGASEIIRMLQKGDLNMSNFDDLVCHGDMLIELAQIRGILMGVFPSKQRGNLGFDMKKLVTHFVNGIDYKSVKDEFEQDFGWVRVPFGRLQMPNEELEQNFKFLLSNIEKHKPPMAPGSFITRVLINCEPSKEQFALKFWNYIEGYKDPNAKEDEEENEEELIDNENVSDFAKL